MASSGSTPLPRRPGVTARTRVVEIAQDRVSRHEDRLAVEEPLEIRVSAPGLPARRLAVTMRTPGHDFELVAGWLLHEGVTDRADLGSIRYCTDVELTPEQEFNVVTAELTAPPRRLPEARVVSSACGVCGAQTLADSLALAPPAAASQTIGVDVARALPDALRASQPGFGRTGGLHAAGLASTDGVLAAVREDVGRHNAVDKVVGAFALRGEALPPILVLSGRVGFELVHKAVVSGLQIVVAVGAPSTLAVDLAERAGITVVGFVREDRCVVYTGSERITGL